MTRQVLIYGALGGVLIVVLRMLEYRYLVVEHAIALYGGLIAVIFVALGLWLGRALAGPKPPGPVLERAIAVHQTIAPTTSIDEQRAALGITKRELEILQLMADGLSNREIAEKLFVTENTVKTHSSRLFEKLDARRRTQAVQRGKAAGLLS